jgi:hypothetical protein
MSTTQTFPLRARAGQKPVAIDHRIALHEPSLGEAVIEAPRLVQVYVSGRSGFGAHGLLKSVSRGGLQVLVPVPVPVRTAVQVTVSGCEPVAADVFYCVKKNAVYQIGIVLRARLQPEVTVGGLAVLNELDEPFTVSRGHIVDIARGSLSVLCKTAIRREAWVRVESDGWVLFGDVNGVVPTSMLASCVSVHLDTAFRAGSSAGVRIVQTVREGGAMRSGYGF